MLQNNCEGLNTYIHIYYDIQNVNSVNESPYNYVKNNFVTKL